LVYKVAQHTDKTDFKYLLIHTHLAIKLGTWVFGIGMGT